MKLEDIKIGQKVRVIRPSTVKFDGIEYIINKIINLSNVDIVSKCEENGGFYVYKIEDKKIILGEKDSSGKISAGWGIFDASDIEDWDYKEKSDKNEILNTISDFICSVLTKLALLADMGTDNIKNTKKGSGKPKNTTKGE